MDALTTTRLLVAEFRVLNQELPSKLPQAPPLASTAQSAQPKAAVEKKRSWLNLSSKKKAPQPSSTTGIRKRVHGSDEQEENNAKPVDPSGIVDDERTAAEQAICGMRRWLATLSTRDPVAASSEYDIQVTTTCRLLLDASREQFDVLAEAGATEGFSTASEPAKIVRKSTGGLLRKFMKSTGSGGSIIVDLDEDGILDEPEDPTLALNALTDILEVPTALLALPMAFVESAISLCYEELNLAATPARKAAAVRCLVVISSRVDALIYLCNSVLLANLQSKKPFPKFSHLLKFGFDSPQRSLYTMKLFSAIVAAMPKLEIDKTELCLVISAIVRYALDGGVASLEKKTHDLFMIELKLCCEALNKWTKKRMEPVWVVQTCFAHAVTVWASMANNEKDMHECFEMRKSIIVDRIIPALKDEPANALRLAMQLLQTEVKVGGFYHTSETWRSQTMGKLFHALLKCVSVSDVQELLMYAIQIQPEYVVGEWMSANLFPASAKDAANHDGSKLLLGVTALAHAFSKGKVNLRADIAASLISKHLEPIMFDERLKASMNETKSFPQIGGTGSTPVPGERSASTATTQTTGTAKDEEELTEQNDEEVGVDIPLETFNPELDDIDVNHDTALVPDQDDLFVQLAVQVIRLFPQIFPPSERYLNQLASLALHPTSVHISSAARQSLLELPLSIRDDVVRAMVNSLATAQIDSACTMNALRILFELLRSETVASPAAHVTGMGVALYHYHASTSGSHRLELRTELMMKRKLKGSSDPVNFMDDRDVKADARALARARLRPALRGLNKLNVSKGKNERKCKEFYGSMKCLCATSGPMTVDSAELNAVLSALFQDLLILPGWLFNRLVSAIQFCLPANCETLTSDALRYRLHSNAPASLPGSEANGSTGAVSYLHPRFIYIQNAIMTAAFSNGAGNATRLSSSVCGSMSESCALLLNSFAIQLLNSTSFAGFYTPSSEEFVWRCFRLLNCFVSLSVIATPFSAPIIATIQQEGTVDAIARLILTSPKGGKTTEAMKVDVIGSLACSHVCIRSLQPSMRTTFTEKVASWWSQVANSSGSDEAGLNKDFVRACKALKSLLHIACHTNSISGSRDDGDDGEAHETLLGFVEHALRDAGPVGSLYFSAVVAWMETLGRVPSKDVAALLVVTTLTQRRNPPDALLKLLTCMQDWAGQADEDGGNDNHLSRDMLKYALMSADEIAQHGDVGVASAASRSVAECSALLKVDPTSVVEQAALLAGRLINPSLSQAEAALRAIVVVAEPWVEVSMDRSDRLVSALWTLSEDLLSSSSSSVLRPMVLNLWRSLVRSSSASCGFVLEYLLRKAIEGDQGSRAGSKSPLVLQVWRAAAPFCNLESIAGAVFLKMNECYSNRLQEVPGLLLELAACALRYGKGKEHQPDGLIAWYLGRLSHFACISEAIEARNLAMRTILRFIAPANAASIDDPKLRESLLKSVAKNPSVMQSAVDSALSWIQQSVDHEQDETGGNLDLAAVSVVFIMELHSKNVSASLATSTPLPPQGLASICRCALRFMRSQQRHDSQQQQQPQQQQQQRKCASLVRSVLRFGCFLRLDSVEEQRLLGGIAGVCLHASPADTQTEAAAVLREELPMDALLSARYWFQEVLSEVSRSDSLKGAGDEGENVSGALDELDGIVQFIATCGAVSNGTGDLSNSRQRLDDLVRVLSKWPLSHNEIAFGPLQALELVQVVLSSQQHHKDNNNTITSSSNVKEQMKVDDGFVDACSALLYWEDSAVRSASLEVLGSKVQTFKSPDISSTVACRALRCAMNELIASSSTSSSSHHDTHPSVAQLAEQVLKKGVGLDDGFSVVPPALTNLYHVRIEDVLFCLDRVVREEESRSQQQQGYIPPPIPRSRQQSPLVVVEVEQKTSSSRRPSVQEPAPIAIATSPQRGSVEVLEEVPVEPLVDIEDDEETRESKEPDESSKAVATAASKAAPKVPPSRQAAVANDQEGPKKKQGEMKQKEKEQDSIRPPPSAAPVSKLAAFVESVSVKSDQEAPSLEKKLSANAMSTPTKAKPELPPGKPTATPPPLSSSPAPHPSRPPRPSVSGPVAPLASSSRTLLEQSEISSAVQQPQQKKPMAETAATSSSSGRSEDDVDRKRKMAQLPPHMVLKKNSSGEEPSSSSVSKSSSGQGSVLPAPPPMTLMQEMKLKMTGSQGSDGSEAAGKEKTEQSKVDLDHAQMERPVIPRGKRRMPSSMKNVLSELGPELRAMKRGDDEHRDDDDDSVDL